MASLYACQASSPEDLRTSERSNPCELRAKRLSTWQLGTWNVHSMVDTYGPVEVANKTRRRESQKVDQIILTFK